MLSTAVEKTKKTKVLAVSALRRRRSASEDSMFHSICHQHGMDPLSAATPPNSPLKRPNHIQEGSTPTEVRQVAGYFVQFGIEHKDAVNGILSTAF